MTSVSRGFVLAIVLLTLLRLIILAFYPLPLLPDEAQYWDWSRDLAWGYYSKPPAIAGIIALTTGVCGNAEFCIRMSSPIWHGLTALLIYLTARALHSEQAGFWSGLLYLTLPGVSFSSMLMTTDVLLLFCWALALYASVRAMQEDKWRGWLLAGIAAGLGLLSKYSMLFFLPSVVGYLWFANRRIFLSKKFYFALAITFFIYLPNLIWNMKYGLVSYSHTVEISQVNQAAFNPIALLEFLGSQFGIFGPLTFACLLWLVAKPNLWRKEPERLLLWFTVPFLGAFLILGFLSRAMANWAAPAYIAASILVTVWLLEKGKKRWLAGTVGLHIILAVILYLHPILPIPDPFPASRGWKELGEMVGGFSRRYPQALLLTDERKVLAELKYYVEPKPAEIIIWNPRKSIRNHYQLTTTMLDKKGRDFLFVSPYADPETIMRHFDFGIEVGNFSAFRIYYLRGFRGYE